MQCVVLVQSVCQCCHCFFRLQLLLHFLLPALCQIPQRLFSAPGLGLGLGLGLGSSLEPN